MLTVYGRATSSNVQALLWGLEELGLAYKRLDYGEVFGGLDTEHFLKMNPNGKIPVLKVGDTALFETGAILRYLANEHGADAFWPNDPLKRAEVDMWAEWAKYSIAEAFTGPLFWLAVRTAPERRDAQKIRENLCLFEADLAFADRRLSSHPFLCGETVTLADIQFGHVLFRYFDTHLGNPKFSAVVDYYQRLTERAAYRKAVMVSYEDLRNTF